MSSTTFNLDRSTKEMIAAAKMMEPYTHKLEKKFVRYSKECELLEKHLKSFNGNCISRLHLRWQAFVHGTTLERDREISAVLLNHFKKKKDPIAKELSSILGLIGVVHLYHDMVQKHLESNGTTLQTQIEHYRRQLDYFTHAQENALDQYTRAIELTGEVEIQIEILEPISCGREPRP